MTESTEEAIDQIERLIRQALDIIPNFTSGRGSFSNVPELGYKARHPADWQREFLEVLNPQLLGAFKPDTNDIVTLVELVNFWTLVSPSFQVFPARNGSPKLLPAETLSTILGYALLEMVVRKLVPGGGRGKNSLERLLRHFEKRTSFRELAGNLASLKSAMLYQEGGKTIDLYNRLRIGRNLLLHGNVLRTHEGEGLLLAPLIDLILLHVMRYELQSVQ